MDVIYLLGAAGFFLICWVLAIFSDGLKEQ